MMGGYWRFTGSGLGGVGSVSGSELEDVCVYGEEEEEETGEGGDEDGEEVREVGRRREEVGPNAEEEKKREEDTTLWLCVHVCAQHCKQIKF